MEESRNLQILQLLASIPRKLVSNQDLENLSEFLMYELCNSQCFNLSKAAYFVDNPDFDCLRGVVGFYKDEICLSEECIWDQPKDFSKRMQESLFNQQVQKQLMCSVRKSETPDEQLIEALAKNLAIDGYCYCSFKVKNDNLGLFVYEKSDKELSDESVLDGVCLFNFCPMNVR